MDMNFIKECEELYKYIGIDQTKWDKYENPHEYASKFSTIHEVENAITNISTSDSVPMSQDTVKGLINA